LTGSASLWHIWSMSDTDIVEVGPKGRVVIPAHIRRRLGIEQGTRLAVLVDDDAVVLVPRSAIERRLHAIFKGVPSSMASELLEERAAEARGEADGV
jgi:AbrB family looped-hinge helix DNA binding protein